MDKNTLKTGIFLAGLGGLLIAVGQWVGGGNGALIGFAIGLLITGASYWFSDKIAVKVAGARPVTEQEAPQLYRMVRELAGRADMPMPRLYVSPATQPNAFATGRNEKHAVVAVTQGLTQVLTEEELRGVLAHELSHVRNHDILMTSVAAAVALGITMVARMVMWASIFGGADDEGQNPIALLALVILAPLAAGLLQMALSRSREFDADHDGAELLGTGEPLARALEKIEAAAKQVPMNVDPAIATAYIVNPLTGRKVNFATLYSTHPPTAERVRRLRAQSGQLGPHS
ncbi:MAG TPA: zinc metalloprotease HtpX [Actinomycetota bacterium]|jgi:heat shock protein HtpX